MDLSLARMKEALGILGPLHCHAVQVLGTNGKGSTCVHIASLAESHGLKCGVFLSPHFLSVKERILVNGRRLTDGHWVDAANRLAQKIPLSHLTYFELLTLLAVEVFRVEGVSLAIFEAGLGGWHDATTAVNCVCQCFTPIAMDHAAVIGPGLNDIAWDKARAMRQSSTVFSAPQYPTVRAILETQAHRANCQLAFITPFPEKERGRLMGQTQAVNAALALACWQWLAARLGISTDAVLEKYGLENAFLPGRMEYIPANSQHPPVILDGAHNPHAIQALLRQLPQKPETVIYAALSDKNWRACLGLLSRLQVPILIPKLDNTRASDPLEMAATTSLATPITGSESLKNALIHAQGLTLICGSLYLVAQFYELFPRHMQ